MASRRFRPGSFLLGSAALGALLFMTSASGVGHELRSLVLQTAPQPKDHVRIFQGTPYPVPRGKVLTLMAFSTDGSTTDFNKTVRIEVEGRGVGTLLGYSVKMGVVEIPFGITVREGQTVDLVDAANSSSGAAPIVVYGYLSGAH